MKKAFVWMILGMSLVGTFGCNVLQKNPVYPTHDEVLIFNLTYDLTYLRVLEAVDNVEGWDLEETDKEKGVIRVRNMNFSRLDDADTVLLTFLIKYMDNKHTSVQLAPESWNTQGAGELLKRIEQYLTVELNKP